MFTPLTFQKNAAIQIDRFDNANFTDSNSITKKFGYGVPQNNYFRGERFQQDGTIVMQVWPNSDDSRGATGAGEQKWMLWNTDYTGVSSCWWQVYIPTANDTQIGSETNYGTLFDSPEGLLKGQICINSRMRPGASNRDAMACIASHSADEGTGFLYDWTDPQPITLAVGYNHTTSEFTCAINGVSHSVDWAYRDTQTSQGNDKWLTDMAGASAASNNTCNYGYAEIYAGTRGISSGSYGEVSYYDECLTSDEMKIITNQPYGQPTNVLDKQPTLLYRFREELKEAQNASSTTGQIGGDTAFPNLGTKGQTTSSLAQAKTVNQQVSTLNVGSITSGSVMNTQAYEYQLKA